MLDSQVALVPIRSLISPMCYSSKQIQSATSTMLSSSPPLRPARLELLSLLFVALSILLATVKELPDLKELAVEDVLHQELLEGECEARGIKLTSSGAGKLGEV